MEISRPSPQQVQTFLRWLQEDHGPQLRQAAGFIAIAIAFTCAAGFALGQMVHKLNQALASVFHTLLVKPDPQPIHQPLLYAVLDLVEGDLITDWTTAHDAAADAEMKRPGWVNHPDLFLVTNEEYQDLTS